MGECNITRESAEKGCLIERLESAKNYTIVAHSCLIDNSTILRSVEVSTTFYLDGKQGLSCSTRTVYSTFLLVQTAHYLNIGLIVGLTLAAVALLITAILLIVYRRRLCGGETDDDDKDY